jgi:ribosomal protein L2
LVVYADGATSFILAPLGLVVGDVIISSTAADIIDLQDEQ